MRNLFQTFLFVFIVLFFTASLRATTYCVSNSGSDSNSGKATGANCTGTVSPWQTITKVNAQSFNPGDSILFQAGGAWSGTLTSTTSGNSSNSITFGSYGTGTIPALNSLSLASVGYLSFSGLRFTNSSAAPYYVGVTLNTANNINILNCQVDSNQNVGIAIGAGSHNIFVSGGKIFGNGTNAALDGGGIGIGEGGAASYNITISGVLLYSNSVASAAGGEITVAETTTNQLPYGILIEYCEMLNDQGSGLQVLAGSITADYNIISGNATNGILLVPPDGVSVTLTADNNTIYNNGAWAIYLYSPGTGTGSVTFENNIVSMNATGGSSNDFQNTSPSAIALVSNYNLFYNSAGFRWRNDGTTNYTLAAWRSATGQDLNSVSSNPLFANAGSGQFWLTSGSPGIDAGLNLGSPYNIGLMPGSTWPNSVVTGDQNAYGSGWEIGGFVYVPPKAPPSNLQVVKVN